MIKRKCFHCGAKALTEIYVGLKLNGTFCADCYNAWYELRDKIVGEAFATYIRPQDSPEGLGTKPVVRRPART